MALLLDNWQMILEIILLWYILYMALMFIKGTRTEQLLKGLVIIAIVFVLTQYLHLDTINWVIRKLFPISVIALLIIFQPELRRGLARLGQFGTRQEDIEVIEETARAVVELAKKKRGAIIALERNTGLKTYIESGEMLDAKVTKELLISIFMPLAPLHDGAVIIQHDRLSAAGCLLPLTLVDKATLHEHSGAKFMGTRHRAAIGLTEETDAVCIIVSEETGSISIAISGRLVSNIEEDKLSGMLKGIFYRPKKKKGWHLKVLSHLPPKVAEKGS